MILTVDIKGRAGALDVNAAFQSDGGVTALYGRSGAGKTTILNMIAGLRRPLSGTIAIGDHTVFDGGAGINIAAPRRRIGYVFQEARLFPHMSVRRNLTYGQWAGGNRSARPIEEIVGLLGIEPLLNRKPAGLSGGEQQRVAIGRALLSNPNLLVMDEPLASLDVKRKAEILPYLERLAKEAEIPILYVSHALSEVARLADRLVIVADGKTVAAGPVEDVMADLDPVAEVERGEAGSVLAGTIAGHDPEWGLTEVTIESQSVYLPGDVGSAGEAVRLRIRADDVALSKSPLEGVSYRNQLTAIVADIRDRDVIYCDLLLKVGGQSLRARITRKAAAELALAPGNEIVALIKSMVLGSQNPG